ncbi:hypothetical protein [Natronomonas sp. EA1]
MSQTVTLGLIVLSMLSLLGIVVMGIREMEHVLGEDDHDNGASH